jgi:archaellum component FlaC
MSEYMTVNDLLKSLNFTEEEFETYKELIEECRENERKISEYCDATKQNIERISRVFQGISHNMNVLEIALEDLITEAERLSLKMIPADKFYRE